MDLRTCLVVACWLGLAVAAPVAQEDMRDFIPDRYDVKGTLINSDGSFSRQDPPKGDEQQFNQFGYDQQNAYQPQNDFQLGQYGQQTFNNFQEPAGYPPQDQQAAYYNREQFPGVSNDMEYTTRSENDDLSNTNQEDKTAEYYNQQPQQEQQFQNFQGFNNLPATPQTQEQSYFGQPQYQQQYYQPQTEETDDMEGATRSKPAQEEKITDDMSSDDQDESSKKSEILRQRMKKFSIPKNLSQKDLQGMLGFQKQIYLRGDH